MKFDRMLTLTTSEAIFDRGEFLKMIEKFIRLTREATGGALPYVLTVEKHDSVKTNETKGGKLTSCFKLSGISVFVEDEATCG